MLRRIAVAWLYFVGAVALALFAVLVVALLSGGETIGLPWFFLYIVWGAGLAAVPGLFLLVVGHFVGGGDRPASTLEGAQKLVLREWRRWKKKSSPATWAEIHEFYSWLRVSRPHVLTVAGSTVGWADVQRWLAPFSTGVEP